MAEPIIIDDGGSTRIRLYGDRVRDLCGLLNVDDRDDPPRATQAIDGPVVHVKIVFIDIDGGTHTVMDNDATAGDRLKINSDNGQSVTLCLDKDSRCILTVAGSPGIPPLVELKQFAHRRSYVVSNAGPIHTIEGVVSGEAMRPFDAAEAESVYTTVVLARRDTIPA
jgi:hypothetical protein